MGWNCYTGVATFAVHSCFEQPHNVCLEESTEFQQKICSPYGYKEEDFCDNPVLPIEVNGWAYLENGPNVELDMVKGEGIGGDFWNKDEHYVFIVNESQYSNVGEYDLAVVSDKRESLEEFLRDFNLTDKNIVETTAVKDWG